MKRTAFGPVLKYAKLEGVNPELVDQEIESSDNAFEHMMV